MIETKYHIKSPDRYLSQLELDKWLVGRYYQLLEQDPDNKSLFFERLRLNDSFVRYERYQNTLTKGEMK
jgi:hypothetical protein